MKHRMRTPLRKRKDETREEHHVIQKKIAPTEVRAIEIHVAPRVGFEPTTLRLTAGCSAVELPRNLVAVKDT